MSRPSIRIISVDGEVAKVEGYAGCNFGDIAKESIALAADLKQEVAFEFNGVPCVVSETSDIDAIWQYINDTWDRQRAEYEATDEYKLNQIKAVKASELRAERMHRILAEFPQIVASNIPLETMQWLTIFTELADYGDVSFDKKGIVAGFALMGYVANDMVGAASELFQDPLNVTRWIVGQAMDMLQSGMPPHPGMLTQMERNIEALESIATTA